MARGLDHALAKACDVVTISHGGLPSGPWATAVNKLYEAGVVVVAAAGNSYHAQPVPLPSRYTVYPSAFNRVVTVVGATHAKQPYISGKIAEMQGCWGPDVVMRKAIAAYTPNLPWMDTSDRSKPAAYALHGGGTSSATPQVAAACALWLELYGARFPRDWRRVEACRAALFLGAAQKDQDPSRLGRGLLDVPSMLDGALADRILADASRLRKQPMDRVSFPFWRWILGIGPPGSGAARQMYELEVAQLAGRSREPALVQLADTARERELTREEAARAREVLLAEGPSQTLAAELQRAA